MSRVTKKSRSVKRVKGSKPQRAEPKPTKKKLLPPRYTLRKDSLDRRYAIDKRTGKRVSVYKADQERAKRQKTTVKAPPVFRRIKPQKTSKPKKARTSSKSRSKAAKKGWETRRANAIITPSPPSEPIVFIDRPPTFAELIGPLIPEGVRMHIVGGLVDRATKYPKVNEASIRAWTTMQIEAFTRQRAIGAGQEPEPIITPRFDRLYGEGHGAFVYSEYYQRASDLSDIDQMAHTLEELDNNDYSIRELYTLYFSPDVA